MKNEIKGKLNLFLVACVDIVKAVKAVGMSVFLLVKMEFLKVVKTVVTEVLNAICVECWFVIIGVEQ